MGESLAAYGGFVIVRKDERKEFSEGGIAIPDVSREEPRTAVVVSVGEGSVIGDAYVPTTLRPGDRVLVSRFWGDDVDVNGSRYTIGREEDVLARVLDDEIKADDGEVVTDGLAS